MSKGAGSKGLAVIGVDPSGKAAQLGFQQGDIILKANPDGELLRLKDVAEIELGPSYYNIYSDIDGHPSAAIVLKQLPGTNAASLSTSHGSRGLIAAWVSIPSALSRRNVSIGSAAASTFTRRRPSPTDGCT